MQILIKEQNEKMNEASVYVNMYMRYNLSLLLLQSVA